eukprot:6270286-Karenia_brevis.AAC.1
MNETRATGLRTLCASGRSAGPRTLHSPVEDDDKCPDLISSITSAGMYCSMSQIPASSSESDAEAED